MKDGALVKSLRHAFWGDFGWKRALLACGALACGALACGTGAAAVDGEGDAVCRSAFPAPAAPVLLSRQLRRSLFDGKELVVTRHYRITFKPVATGFQIDGALIATDVEAPERLSQLADLEKARKDATMFPIQLDKGGRIASRFDGGDGPIPDSAQTFAGQLIAGAGLKSLVQGQANDFVDRLFSSQGPVISQWPEALFRPGNQPRLAREELPLPGGGKGTVTITLAPKSATPCGLVERMERTVETEVGAQKRRTQEIWTLKAAP
jgi:hypothetical protein